METGTLIMVIVLTAPIWGTMPFYVVREWKKRNRKTPKPKKQPVLSSMEVREQTPKEAYIEMSVNETKPEKPKVLLSAKGRSRHIGNNVFETDLNDLQRS